MRRLIGQLLTAIRFRADTVRRLEQMTARAYLAEHTLRDYDRKLAVALVERSKLAAEVQALSRPRRRRSSQNLSESAQSHGEALA
jgi:hypothetical protein